MDLILSTYVLGVTSLADGFTRVQIAPQPVDLAWAWAEGTVPTPHGAIQVRWAQSADAFHLVITMPAPCGLQIVLPCAATRITVNGEGAWASGQTAQTVDGLTPQERAPGQFDLVGETGGTYTIQVVKQ